MVSLKDPVKTETLGRSIARFMVRGYQLCVSPWLPPCCRYFPTCSSYALEAIERHGALKGLYLAVIRIGRCHPFCEAGVDLVPETFCWRPWRLRDQGVRQAEAR